MVFNPLKGHAALRRGRSSQPGAVYFLTACTDDKRVALTAQQPAGLILQEAKAMEEDGSWTLHCATVMPDHIHLLVTLGSRLFLGQTIKRLKAKTAATLRTAKLRWEHDFFDRQLRADDDPLTIFLYIYLNPYRAGLCSRGEIWPWYYCRAEDWAWFKDYLDHDLPVPEWLQ